MSCNKLKINCDIWKILLKNTKLAVEKPELSDEEIEYLLNAPIIFRGDK